MMRNGPGGRTTGSEPRQPQMEDHAAPLYEIEVIAGAKAPAFARAAVAQLVASQLAERIGAVRLSISEVVTNAIRHGDLRRDIDVVRITVGTGHDKVKVTVEQPTVADVRVGQPRLGGEDVGGFGLHLLDRIADGWGYDPVPLGAYGSSSASRPRLSPLYP